MGTTQSGVPLSESSLLHLGVGVEGGYDSNVFYGENDVKSSAILRVLPFLELTNATRGGAVPSNLFFDLGAGLTYREYLSNDPAIRAQRAFMPSVFGTLEVGKFTSLGLAVGEAFSRTEDPPYLNLPNQQPITRNVNQANAALRWAPGGGRIGSSLSYTNELDLFDTDNLRIANSMANTLTLDTAWKWLPKTAFVLTLSQGYITYLNSDPTTGQTKPTSYPFRALLGLRGLITAKLTVNLAAGYLNTFYQIPTNPNLPARQGPSGFSGNFTAIADLIYRPTLTTAVDLGYRKDVQNAVLGDFYYLDAVYLNIGQAIAGRVGAGVSVRYESRQFQNVPVTVTPAGGMGTMGGVINRHDNYWQVGANLDYHMREWTYVGVAYTLMSNGSDYVPAAPDDPGRVNYFKQLVFARLGLAY